MSFIEKARSVHGDKYDYSKSVYVNSKTKLTITCKAHGDFEQIPNSHLCGSGCPDCGKKARNGRHEPNTQGFIKKANAVHGDKYDYSKSVYIKSKQKVVITCTKHGDFEQTPNSHLAGQGCRKCGKESMGKKQTLSKDQFLKKAKSVHGDKYDYSLVDYVGVDTAVKIVCSKHGVFNQKPHEHMIGRDCLDCGNETSGIARTRTTSYFIEKAHLVHGDRYDYSKSEYKGVSDKISIICSKHGEFTQVAGYHMQGAGCPSCAVRHSNAELEMLEMLNTLGVKNIHGDRSLINPYELDIYLPEHNLAIEYNGLRWHTEEFGKDKHYHQNKTELCKDKGVRLIHIWEDEWLNNKQMQLDFIKNLTGHDDRSVIYARKTSVSIVEDKQLVREILNDHHIQGSCMFTTAIGLYHGDDLVTVTCFTKRGDKFELVRHVSTCAVIGSLGKTSSFFHKLVNCNMYTFCDLSRFDGRSYEKAGFVVADTINPDYRYVVGTERQHKFNWRRKSILSKLPEFYNEDLTEREMMLNAKISRIWDCGKTRYEYNRRTTQRDC